MTTPLDPLEVIQALIPGSRVAVMRLEDDPVIPPWSAWIEWHDKGPKDITVGAWSKREALVALREAARRRSRGTRRHPRRAAQEG